MLKARTPLRGNPPLPVGTRVRRLDTGQIGTVQTYQPECSVGTFPVRWSGTGLWALCGSDDVAVIPIPSDTQLRLI